MGFPPLLIGLLLACGGPPQADAPDASSTKASRPLIPEEEAVAPATVEATVALMDRAVAASAACRSVLGAIDPAAVETAPFPMALDAVHEACGEVHGLHDGAVGDLAGRSRSADILLMYLARVAEDFDYLHRVYDQDMGDVRRGAIEHVFGSLDQLDQGVRQVRSDPRQRYDMVYQPKDGVDGSWNKPLDGDQWSLGGLASAFQQLAFDQGFEPWMVRRRMLASFLRIAEAEAAARRRALDSAGDRVPPEEIAARARYLDVVDAMVAAYATALDGYVRGEVTSEPVRQSLVERTQAADAAWRAAWPAERVRCGLAPEPPR